VWFWPTKAHSGASADRKRLVARLVRQDAFDVPYLNLFADWEDDDDAWKPEAIAKLNVLLSAIEKGLRENGKNPGVAEKYRWMGRILQAFVESKHLGSSVLKIDS